MRKLVGIWMFIFMLFSSFALADETQNIDLQLKQDDKAENITSLALVGSEVYCFTDAPSLFRLDEQKGALEEMKVSIDGFDPMKLSSFYRTGIEKGYYELSDAEQDAKRTFPDMLISNDSCLMALSTYTGLLYTFDENMTAIKAVALEWDSFIPTIKKGYKSFCDSAVLYKNTLYLVISYYDEDTDVQGLFAFDTSNGRMDTVIPQNVQCILPYKNGQMLCQMQTGELYAMDGLSGKRVSKLNAQNTAQLCYNAFSHTLYTLSSGALMPMDDKGNHANAVANIPISSSSSADMVMPNDTLAVVACEDALYLRDISHPAGKQRLTIKSFAAQSHYQSMDTGFDTIQAFRQLRPDVEVVNYDNDPDGNIQCYAESMVNRSEDIDIFELPVGATYTQGREKGYFHDLSNIPGMRGQYENMYPVFQSVVTDLEGRIIAYPANVSRKQLGYSNWAKAQIGLNTLPQTYDELADLLLNWQENSADIEPHFVTKSEMRQFLLDAVLDVYILYCQNDYQAAQQISDEVIKLLNKINTLPDSKNDPFKSGSSASFKLTIDLKPDYLLSTRVTNIPGRMAYAGRECIADFSLLPLKIAEDVPVIYPMTMTVYVINPYSKNIALAEEYIENYARLVSPTDNAVFFKGDWIEESKFYIGPAKQQRASLEEIESRLKQDKGSQVKELKTQLEAINKTLEDLAVIRYSVNEEIVSDYAAMLENVVINYQDGAWNELDDLKFQLNKREIDAQTCVSEILRLIHMQSLEE